MSSGYSQNTSCDVNKDPLVAWAYLKVAVIVTYILHTTSSKVVERNGGRGGSGISTRQLAAACRCLPLLAAACRCRLPGRCCLHSLLTGVKRSFYILIDGSTHRRSLLFVQPLRGGWGPPPHLISEEAALPAPRPEGWTRCCRTAGG